MSIIAVVLFTLLPTLLFYILLSKIGIRIKSKYLKIAFAWFAGLYILTFLTLLFSIIYNTFTSSILLKATFTSLLLVNIAFFFYLFDLQQLLMHLARSIKAKTFFKTKDVALLTLFFLFSFFFFHPHLAYKNDTIYRSPIYWDFNWHVGVIQNFVYGDNFPPENESFGGVPMTYHFFGDMVIAMYEALGLNLVEAVNFVSILAFFFLLVTIVGFSEEFFKSKNAGFIAAILTITSSSGHFTYYFQNIQNLSFFEIVGNILNNTAHPWNASFISGNPSGYTGVMFNLFYFLEERHMIFGIVYLLLSLWIIDKRDEFPKKTLLIIGALMGAYFLWHIYITIMVLCALMFVLIFDAKRKQTMLLLIGFGSIFAAHFFYLKNIVSSVWFYPQTQVYPKINFSFAAFKAKELTTNPLLDMIEYYRFAYGLKIVLLPISLFFIWLKNKRLGIVHAAIIIPTFLLINSVQLTEHGGIGENHKWIRPMNIVVDIATAYIVYILFFKGRKMQRLIIGCICMFFLTVSGVIELMPFLNSKPTEFYAKYPTPLTTSLKENTSPKAVFISSLVKEVHLAGRKTFTGDSAGPNDSMNKPRRQKVIDDIYAASDKQTFCQLTNTYGVDFIEVDNASFAFLSVVSGFTTLNENNDIVTFINTKKTCLH